MGWSDFIFGFFALIVIVMLGYYFFFPYNQIDFSPKYNNSNFSIGDSSKGMQFYENMRYPSKEISYKIEDCPLNKKNNVEDAFEIISNLTVLEFKEVSSNEEIHITCDSRKEMDGNLIVAGEGGPANITKTDNFNVITKGEVMIFRESQCEKPIVGMHEIFHALGFDHSDNPGNVMYEVSDCDQEVGDDIVSTINDLYSYPTYMDLAFEDASATMNGRYLDANISVRNHGLKESGSFVLLIYADEDQIKEIEVDSLQIGYGTTLNLGNVWVSKLGVNEIKFVIKSESDELNKNNNEVRLELKE
ncbi:matrixin family metalloprotease [Candidatus Pacearchaeota archaeon]|nr:matrixin family metalloprotease [Candidatus Pacearchaeota archaeon]